MRIGRGHEPPQRGASEPFDFHLAPRRRHAAGRGGTQDLGIVSVSHDHAAAFGQERVGL